MTIAVIWQEDGHQWCAADTRLVSGTADQRMTEIASKIFVIPVAISALDPDHQPRVPHSWTQYGFVHSGAATSCLDDSRHGIYVSPEAGAAR
jgi:hypothetical protein